MDEGSDVLREAGWTTQIMQRPEVAVRSGGPKYICAHWTGWGCDVGELLICYGHVSFELYPALAASLYFIVSRAAIISIPSHKFRSRIFSLKLCWLLS